MASAQRLDNTEPKTTFVEASPSTFRSIVQQLTGAPEPELRAAQSRLHHPKRYVFKINERRVTGSTCKSFRLKDLSVHLNLKGNPSVFEANESSIISPVSTLEFLSSVMMSSSEDAEERKIDDKGTVLRGLKSHDTKESDQPKLLSLFPLKST